jgi:hypothetical protein
MAQEGDIMLTFGECFEKSEIVLRHEISFEEIRLYQLLSGGESLLLTKYQCYGDAWSIFIKYFDIKE